MTINKYVGKTEEEAKAKAREELGSAAVIMNVKENKPKGLSGLFKNSTFEVTAAVEDDFSSKETAPIKATETLPHKSKTSSFEAVADDDLDVLRDAFSAVNHVLEKQDNEPKGFNKSLQESEVVKKQADESNEQTDENFSPLSEAVPRAHIVQGPTYSKPKTAPKMPKQAEANAELQAVKPLTQEEKRPKPARMPNTISGSTNKASIDNENHVFVKMLYNVLLDNEVQEKYINQVLEDMDKVLQTSHSIDNLLSNVYQKMVLKLGTPQVIKPGERRPKVVFFVGPTGVGKTTTIAKIASKFKVEDGKKVGIITADTYRMAAPTQLQTYANILGVSLNVVYSSEDLLDTVKKQSRTNEDLDVILVDTTGFSHKNNEQKENTKKLITALDGFYDTEVYLVLSATTKQKDLIEIIDSFSAFSEFGLIFTKLDETSALGNIFNMKLYSGAPLSYVTCGQNVPDDIEVLNAQKLVKQLLGGN